MKKIFLLPLICLSIVSCKPQAQQDPTSAKVESPSKEVVAAAPSQSGDVLARINGEAITDAEVTEAVKSRLKKLEAQIFEIKRDGLSEVIEDRLVSLEAKKQNMSKEDYIQKELKMDEPSEQEIQTFYSMFKDKYNNEPLDKIKPQLIGRIKETRAKAQIEQILEKLRAAAKIEVLMERPRVEVSVDDDPSMGTPGAPITLIEFSEFQCPFCKRTRPTIDKILETYKDKVHYVFRDFPLSFHKQAPMAAKAANCAGEQDKYWDYNHMLFENQREIAPENLKTYAENLKLNMKKFDECLASDKGDKEIEKDTQDGMQAGVSGTPAYFINGIFLSGAQPFENFKEIIDEELQNKK